jgi:hypothetical protein
MQFIISLGIIALFLFIASIIFFLIAISKKKMPLFYLALILSFLGVGTGLYAGYVFIQKSYFRISDSLKQRTGDEIYAALFDGKPEKCTVVLETQDQMLPIIDVAIYLHFKTCEAELNRILKQQHYEMSLLEKYDFDTSSTTEPDWFKPLKMSDSIFVYTYKKNDFGSYQTLFVSKKKDEVYCMDVTN